MNLYQSNAPPKLWNQMSRKKKAKYMDAMKLLYGATHAQEGNSTRNSHTHGKTRASEALYVDEKK